MAQASELPDRINLQLRREEDKKLWRRVRERVAEDRDVESDYPSRPTIAREAMRAFLDESAVSTMRDDARIDRTRELVAKDHGVPKEEVSLEAAIYQACAAYAGFQRTDDWRV